MFTVNLPKSLFITKDSGTNDLKLLTKSSWWLLLTKCVGRLLTKQSSCCVGCTSSKKTTACRCLCSKCCGAKPCWSCKGKKLIGKWRMNVFQYEALSWHTLKIKNFSCKICIFEKFIHDSFSCAVKTTKNVEVMLTLSTSKWCGCSKCSWNKTTEKSFRA